MTIEPQRFSVSEHGLRAKLAGSEPALLDGPSDRWSSREKWTFDWFRRELGEEKVPVQTGVYQRAAVPNTAERVGESQEWRLADYIDAVLQNRNVGYVAGPDIFAVKPSLKRDLRFPSMAPSSRLMEQAFWMGAAGVTTQLHVDFAHNLYCQFRGRKRWQLYSPDRNAELDPVAIHWMSLSSGHDLDRAGRLPTPDYDFVIQPGEMLYLPFGWWHRVETLEPSIAANQWWWSTDLIRRKGPNILLGACRQRLHRWRHSGDVASF